MIDSFDLGYLLGSLGTGASLLFIFILWLLGEEW